MSKDPTIQTKRTELVSSLVNEIAHDFNNILVAIICNTQLAQSLVSGNTQANKHLGAVLHSAERAGDLVRQLLAFNRSAEISAVPRGQGENILFIHAEKVLANLGQKTLTSLGYNVETATQPAAALDLVRSDPQRFALAVIDQFSPERTHLILAGQLRQLQPMLRVVLMSAADNSPSPEQLSAAGVRQVLAKPFTLLSLGAAVHAALLTQPRS